MKNLVIISFLLLVGLNGFGQLYGEYEVAIIKDEDGFTLIRKSADVNSQIVDTLFNEEFFQYVKTDTSDWYKAYKMWYTTGYVHKSRIQNLKSLDRTSQHNLIDSIFDKEVILYKETIKSPVKERGKGWYHHEENLLQFLIYLLGIYVNHMMML